MSELIAVKEFTFDAAHYLPDYKGSCGRMHGHTYRLRVGVKKNPKLRIGISSKGPSRGMVIDFSGLKKLVSDAIISKLDHVCLNDVSAGFFPRTYPTAENMILWMRYVLSAEITKAKMDISLSFIQLWETPTSFVELREDE